MDFFQQLATAGAGKTDLTMRIMEKNGKLTLNIMPGAGSSSMQPILVTGTPAELDAEFFTSIAPQVVEISGLVTNIGEVKKELEEKKAAPAKEKNATAEKKDESKSKKKVPVAKKSKAPATVELDIFSQAAGADAAEKETGNEDADEETTNEE